jgi:hypothetical protein
MNPPDVAERFFVAKTEKCREASPISLAAINVATTGFR